MKVTKNQLRRIIKEETQKMLRESNKRQSELVTETVADMRQLEDEVSKAAYGVSSMFAELMYQLGEEGDVEVSPTWDDEVDQAMSELDDLIRQRINAAIEQIEAKLTNIGYSDFPSR